MKKTSAVLCLIPSSHDRADGDKTSSPNPFEGRGRGRAAARRAHYRVQPHGASLTLWNVEWIAPEDARAYRADFKRRWQAFLRAEFRSTEAVAAHFGVTFQAAWNWWEGLNSPSGHTVALAAMQFPMAFAAQFGEAA